MVLTPVLGPQRDEQFHRDVDHHQVLGLDGEQEEHQHVVSGNSTPNATSKPKIAPDAPMVGVRQSPSSMLTVSTQMPAPIPQKK